MPILLIGSGLILILSGVNGHAPDLYNLVKGDFAGPKNFIYWMLSILVLGALGYVKGMEHLSKLFLILVIIVLFLDNGGFFSQFQSYINQRANSTPQQGAKQ